MKKSDFVNLLFGVIGGLLFGIGMCMCLIPEWNTFTPGVVVTAIGALALLILIIKVIKAKSNPDKKINRKIVGKILYGIFSSLILGLGMCLIMVWEMMILGIIIGIVGIIMLLCLIPICVGFKEN